MRWEIDFVLVVVVIERMIDCCFLGSNCRFRQASFGQEFVNPKTRRIVFMIFKAQLTSPPLTFHTHC